MALCCQWNPSVTDGDVHLAVFYDCALVSTIVILRGSAWTNAMGAINQCVAFIDGGHGKNEGHSPERNPFRAVGAKKSMEAMRPMTLMGPRRTMGPMVS